MCICTDWQNISRECRFYAAINFGSAPKNYGYSMLHCMNLVLLLRRTKNTQNYFSFIHSDNGKKNRMNILVCEAQRFPRLEQKNSVSKIDFTYSFDDNTTCTQQTHIQMKRTIWSKDPRMRIRIRSNTCSNPIFVRHFQ